MNHFVPVVLLSACSTSPEASAGTSTGSTSAQGTTSNSTGSSSGRLGTTRGGSTSPSGSISSSSWGDDAGLTFIAVPDGLPERIECSIFEQDCPRGHKCNAWANDGGSAWNATRCVPIDPDPDAVGEPCTVQRSGVSGLDSCVRGAMCWDSGPLGEGTCHAYCQGDLAALSCADPNAVCVVGGQGTAVLSLCFPQCDPLSSRSCSEDESCVLARPERFVCLSGSPEGPPRSACDGPFDCAAGSFCAQPEQASACDPPGARCCVPFCDLFDPACPLGTSCAPFFADGEAAPIVEHLGFCEQAD